MAASHTYTKNLDDFLFIVHGVSLRADEQVGEDLVARVLEIFPDFNPNNNSLDEYVTDYTMEVYSFNRSIGLSVAECAHQLEYPGKLFEKMLTGTGLSLLKLKQFAESEVFAMSSLKAKHLKNLEGLSNGSDWRASVAFLEKVFPEDLNKSDNESAYTFEIDVVESIQKPQEPKVDRHVLKPIDINSRKKA